VSAGGLTSTGPVSSGADADTVAAGSSLARVEEAELPDRKEAADGSGVAIGSLPPQYAPTSIKAVPATDPAAVQPMPTSRKRSIKSNNASSSRGSSNGIGTSKISRHAGH
jgi:hypothetical protein